MADISALTPYTTAATALSNLILVSPQKTIGYQPQNPPNADGSPSTDAPPKSLLFNYEGEQTGILQSEITDHFVEDNSAIADQIALKPERVTTHGFIGELNDIPPALLKIAQTLANKLTTVDAYVPALSTSALVLYNQAFQLYQIEQSVENSAVSTWDTLAGQGGESVISSSGLTSQPSQTKQQVAFQQFYGYWRNRTLFTVQTPWAVFQNMAIENLRAIQDAETDVITDFEVTFKMIRTAQTQTTKGFALTYQGRLNSQAASLTDQGTSTPVASLGVNTQLGNSFPGLLSGA